MFLPPKRCFPGKKPSASFGVHSTQMLVQIYNRSVLYWGLTLIQNKFGLCTFLTTMQNYAKRLFCLTIAKSFIKLKGFRKIGLLTSFIASSLNIRKMYVIRCLFNKFYFSAAVSWFHSSCHSYNSNKLVLCLLHNIGEKW